MTLSRWCAATEPEIWELNTNDGDGNWTATPITVSPHDLCRYERRHDRSHLDCCAGDDEKESWACTCACHEGGSGRRMT